MFTLNFKIYVGLSTDKMRITRLSVAIEERGAILIIRRRADDVSVMMDLKEMGQHNAHFHQVIKDHIKI